jgi:tetratricopeptide (TPR) repeat protein
MPEKDPATQQPLVYTRKVSLKLGSMGTERTQESESYYFANFLPDGQIALTLLDYQDNPTQIILTVSQQELEDQYTLLPDYLSQKKTPQELNEAKHVAIGDRHLAKKEYFSAEFEYGNAIAVNPESVRGHYGKGKALFERGEMTEAEKVFEKLANIKELYGKKYKHTFNSLGIDLRKMEKFDEAIRNYKRAIFMDPVDEVLHYNIAHAYYKKGLTNEAERHLQKALTIKPDFEEGKQFLDRITNESASQSK